MILLPRCLCCNPCALIENATSMFVEISSEDYSIWTHAFSTTFANLFPGSAYSGLFELTRMNTPLTDTSIVWRYQYSAGERTSGDETLYVVLSNVGTEQPLAVRLLANLRIRSATLPGTVIPSASDFFGPNSEPVWFTEQAGPCANIPLCLFGQQIAYCECSRQDGLINWESATTCRRTFSGYLPQSIFATGSSGQKLITSAISIA